MARGTASKDVGAIAHAPARKVALPDDLRTYVTIRRNDPSDFGHRQIIARLDKTLRVTLMYGEEFTCELSPGAHHLRVHNTLVWKNIAFYVEPGEHLEFVVINRGGLWAYAVMALMPAPLGLTVLKRSTR